MGRCIFRPKAVGSSRTGTGLTACDARRFCPRQVRRQHREVRRLNHPPLGLAHRIGAVGLFRSPNLSSASPMTPATGVDAGAGKAGLIQSSATSPTALECRKVLFRQMVTAIPEMTCRLFPERKTALEFAVGAHGSTVTNGLIWRTWVLCRTAEFASSCADFVRLAGDRSGFDAVRPGESDHSSTAAQSASAPRSVRHSASPRRLTFVKSCLRVALGRKRAPG